MSICPKCDGKGKTVEYDGLRKFWCDYKCEVCNGTGQVEQTNEEWFASLSTEEKANWMSQHFHYCDICDRHVCQGGEECKWYDRNMSESDIFKEWLKAVHKE